MKPTNSDICVFRIEHTPISVSRIDIIPRIEVYREKDVSLGEFVRFALDTLQWIGVDNNVGVVKYNTLFASSDWSLEEIEIEEIL